MKKVLAWLLVLIWMSGIFYFSSEVGDVSGGRSTYIKNIVKKTVLPSVARENSNEKTDKLLELIIRKIAHITEYLILTLLLFNALQQSGINGRRRYYLAIAIAIAYASFDEIHQLFTSGRDGRVIDVLIDSIGAFTGAYICRIGCKHSSKRPISI